MSNKNFNMFSIDKIVSEERSKTYGANDLRIIYLKHINRAFIIAAVLFVLALVGCKVMPVYRKEMSNRQAAFPGGQQGYEKFLQKNLKYPKAASDAGVEGKVFLQFIVEKNGSIDNVKVLKSLGYGCDAEAIRVVKMMPRWTPAQKNGNVIRSEFTITINFVLMD
ncbi:MAG: energy transducer TonB [Cytophagales bacterium]|nr:MAG: energy transducer TonB [Cytophagales bacterium]TAF59789.1 MAG: energy transducer TonB [Cytophagales bacterium]